MINQICKQIVEESNKYNLHTHQLAKQHKELIIGQTAAFPTTISLSKRILAVANNCNCVCKQCGHVHGDYTKEFCTSRCYQAHREQHAFTDREYAVVKAKRDGERKFAKLKEGYDYQVCQICQAKTGDLGTHITVHGITSDEYRITYKVNKLKPQRHQEMRRGKNNPAYQHAGRLSAWSKNFVHGYDAQRHAQAKQAHSEFVKANGHLNKFMLEYWLTQAAGDQELAEHLYIQSQTRDLAWFVERYGEIEGVRRHREKTEKWMKSFKSCNFSKISQELFNKVAENVDCTYVYYATFDRPEMQNYKNKEYILRVGDTYVRPDFVDLLSKKIIEFDGDYWHSETVANPLREQQRDTAIKKENYSILHVKEYEYKKNKQKVIEQCINFLIPSKENLLKS